MDYSALEICNKALRLVGQMPLTKREFNKIQKGKELDGNKIINAKAKTVVGKLYYSVKDEILDLCNWKVATKHTQLKNYTIDNACKLKYRFPLPLDVIRIISANDDFIRQGIYVFSKRSVLNVSYIARIDEKEMDYVVINLIALRLAIELCLCVLNDDDKLKVMEARFEKTFEFSKKLDALEEQEAIELAKDVQYSWITVRR